MQTFIKLLCASIIFITLFVLWNIHCTKTLVIQNDGDQTIYIAEYPGNHNSLLLPKGSKWVEFSFGDWDVYGISKVNFWTGFKSMGLPSQGALGTRTINWNGNDPKSLVTTYNLLKVIAVKVPIEHADRLRHELETWLDGRKGDGLFNQNNNLFFVKHPAKYAAWNTCNSMLVKWLREMGLKVTGNGWAGNFESISTEPKA